VGKGILGEKISGSFFQKIAGISGCACSVELPDFYHLKHQDI